MDVNTLVGQEEQDHTLPHTVTLYPAIDVIWDSYAWTPLDLAI